MDTVFALDVGTRNVVGILTKMSGDKIEISQMEIMEHETRAMEDGQIHDIGKVANVSEMIKKKLEEKSGTKIDKVAVAVAGRTLVSQKGSAQKELNIKAGETSEDMKFTLSGLRCIGACGLAPVVMINDKVYGRVEADQIKKILEEYK